MSLPTDLTRELNQRLKSIRGQLDGLMNMLNKSNDPVQVMQQFKAVRNGLENAQHILLDEVYRKTLAIRLSQALDTCPGNCGLEEQLAALRRDFPELKDEELAATIQKLEELYSRLLTKTEPPAPTEP
ncbi:MAG: metal-sensing transcriptional repressor [Balneolaceae bacterium]